MPPAARSTHAPLPRLLMLHPKTLVDSWPMPVDTLGEIIKVPSLVYPLLAATIRHLPIELETFDGYVSRMTLRGYRRMLARADYLAITVMTPLKALDTELTIRLAKRLNPDLRVIVGGNHASAFPERWLDNGADFAIVREGERAFPALMDALILGDGDVSGVAGVVYRDSDGAIQRNEAGAALAQLDDSPFPAWDAFDLRPYDLGTPGRGLSATIEVSRGCPHRCDFCNINKYWDYRQRYKSHERVLAEMDRLHHIGVRKFMFADDNFGGRHNYTCALFEEMIRRGYGFEFGAFIRGDTVYKDPEFAALAARAGLRLALVGIETLDEAWLDDHSKGVRADNPAQMYMTVYERLHRHGVFLLGLFINSTDPDGPARSSGHGLDGRVCDFHYAADLLPQKNSALYDDLVGDDGVRLKDMFYHDWNMPSMRRDDRVQTNRKSLAGMFERAMHSSVARGLLSRDRMLRRYWWRHVGLAAERLACTTADDVRRYRWAKADGLTPEQRQQRIVESALHADTVERLATASYWRSPLALRTGVWSVRRPPPSRPAGAVAPGSVMASEPPSPSVPREEPRISLPVLSAGSFPRTTP